MEIKIKMRFVITLISAAIMIINFINFKCPFTFKKQCHSLSRTHKFQERSTEIFTTCRIKLDVKKYASVNPFTTLMPANLSILIMKDN